MNKLFTNMRYVIFAMSIQMLSVINVYASESCIIYIRSATYEGMESNFGVPGENGLVKIANGTGCKFTKNIDKATIALDFDTRYGKFIREGSRCDIAVIGNSITIHRLESSKSYTFAVGAKGKFRCQRGEDSVSTHLQKITVSALIDVINKKPADIWVE